MNSWMTRTAITVGLLSAGLAYGEEAHAQDTSATTTTTTSAAPQPTTTVVQPAPAQPAATTNVIVAQPAPAVGATTTTSAPVAATSAGAEESESGYAPNRWMLTSGLIVFGVPYLSSVIVGAASAHQGDNNLYVPLAGPWMDIGNRGGCPAGSSCDSETTNKVLLGVDGVFQAIGVLEIVSALLIPETKTVTHVKATAYTPEMTVTPAKVGANGYGLAALAVF